MPVEADSFGDTERRGLPDIVQQHSERQGDGRLAQSFQLETSVDPNHVPGAHGEAHGERNAGECGDGSPRRARRRRRAEWDAARTDMLEHSRVTGRAARLGDDCP